MGGRRNSACGKPDDLIVSSIFIDNAKPFADFPGGFQFVQLHAGHSRHWTVRVLHPHSRQVVRKGAGRTRSAIRRFGLRGGRRSLARQRQRENDQSEKGEGDSFYQSLCFPPFPFEPASSRTHKRERSKGKWTVRPSLGLVKKLLVAKIAVRCAVTQILGRTKSYRKFRRENTL